MSNVNLPALIEEISHEISRDGTAWYFTQRAAARISGMDWKTIREGLQVDKPDWLGAGLGASKMLKSIAAQGISPAGLEQFKEQWKEGRITDVLVSCLITYHATQKKGPKDVDVVALHGVLVAGGLRGLLDSAFNIEDVGGRVTARLNGIGTRVSYANTAAKYKKNIGKYTAIITGAITGHPPKAWNNSILPGQFGDKAGRIRDHADELTVNLIEAAERGMSGSINAGRCTPENAAAFAAGLRRAAEQHLGYSGPELSPAKLTPRVTRQINNGRRQSLADSSTGDMPLLPAFNSNELD